MDPGSPIDDITETLTRILIDDLSPAIEAYRRATARRLGIEPVDLLCLDVTRRLGTATASALADWTGLTRSALSKTLRRLEAGGHVIRVTISGSGEVAVRLTPQAERDAELGRRRERLMSATGWTVADHGLADPRRGSAVRDWALATTTVLFREAKAVADHEAALRRRLRIRADEARRRERRAAGLD